MSTAGNTERAKPFHMNGKTDTLPKQIADVLCESEEKYRTLTENITLGIFRSTPGPRGSFIEVNSAFADMLGYPGKHELFELDVAQVYKDPTERAKFSEKLSKTGSLKNEELNFIKKDGTPITVSVTAIAVRHKNGKILYFDGIVEDITERKKAEEEFCIQKVYLERLFNSAPEAIVLHDTNDIVVNVNAEFIRMFGYSREEAIGRPINDLVASTDFRDNAAMLSYKVLHGERVNAHTKRSRKDGKLIDVSILGAPIVHEGKQMGVYAIYRDITDRKKAEKELVVQKIYLEKLFSSAPEAIVLHDTNDQVVNVNPEFTRLFGYSREEAIGTPINELVAPKEFLDEAEILSERVIHGERVEADTQRKRKDGTLVDVWILGAPIIHDGEQIGVYAIYRDITERRKAEEARIRLREEARMAKNIQMNFLPKCNPVIEGYDIAGRSIPALNVGGDYYDFIFLDDHRLAVGLGDVSGHGLAAALVMANLQATIRGQVLFDADPAATLERANKLLFQSISSKIFVSLFYGILDTQKNTLIYANAGQDMPLLFSTGKGPLQLKTRGIALGMVEDVSYASEEIPIAPGDRLLIYTDGIREAMNEGKTQFGEEKIRRIMQDNGSLSADALTTAIIHAVNKHFGDAPQNDDMTMVVLSRKE